jgi:hypothetical protein
MSGPTPPVIDVVNDPNYVPLAANANGDVLVTEDGTILIVSSTLRVRGPRTAFIGRKNWMKVPPLVPQKNR